MKKYVVRFLILFGITIENGAGIELPNYIVPCEASNETCLKNTLHSLQPHLVQGIKQFQLPSVVPLHVPDFNYSKEIPPDVDFTAALANIEFGQANDYKVSKINIDLNHLKFLLVLTFPELTLTMNERASGRGLGLKVNWDGIMRLTFKNVTVSFSLDGTEVFKEGKRYVNWRKENVDLSTGSIIYDVKDLLKKKELIKAFLEKLDQNREFVDGEAKFILKNTFAEYIFHVINVVHTKYPISVLYANQ